MILVSLANKPFSLSEERLRVEKRTIS